MFIHNLKYTVRTLFRTKMLIFWTFAFPIILGFLFNLAFANLEKDEVLQLFDIAVVDTEDYQSQEMYKEAFKALSDDNSDNKLFNVQYVSEAKANELLDKAEIKGYIIFENDEPKVVVKENGVYQTVISYVVTEISKNKTMVEDLSSKAIEKEISNGNYNIDQEQIVNNILDKINNTEIKKNNISNSNLSYTQIEFFTLIAMACLYGGTIGLTAINRCLANMSNHGKRMASSPCRKSILVLSSILGGYFVSLVGIALLMLFLLFVIKINFGNNLGLIILLTMLGDLAGTAMGVMIASCFRVSEGAKIGITIAVSMFCSILAGMTGIVLKYVIDTNVPILNLINPANLITDGYYSLYYYDTLDRYFRDILFLIIFIVICFVISFCSLRREKYDSI